MPVIINNLLNLKEVSGEYFFEMILLCALTAIMLVSLGVKLSQKALSDRVKINAKAGGKL